MDEVIELWKRVNTLIKIRNTTQSALSTKCGFSQRRIQNLSGTNRPPDAVEITKIAEALGTSVEYLVTGSGPQCQIPDDLMEVMRKYVLRKSLDNPVKDYLK